jgi:hypothetical protein
MCTDNVVEQIKGLSAGSKVFVVEQKRWGAAHEKVSLFRCRKIKKLRI